MRRLARRLGAAAAVACLLSAGARAAEVLTPGAAGPLRLALDRPEPLDGRLVFQGADLERERVRVRFGATREGAASFEAVLTAAPAAEGGGPFLVEVVSAPPDGAALAALSARLATLARGEVWTRVEETPIPEPGALVPETASRREEAERAIRDALHALQVDGPEKAAALLGALEKDEALADAAGLDLAEALHRAGKKERAVTLARRLRDGLPAGAPAAVRLRADVLSGSDAAPERVAAGLADADARCGIGAVVSALDAVGRRNEGYGLLETAAGVSDCKEPGLVLSDWLLDDARVPEADRATSDLLRRFPDDEEVRARRAQVLMAKGEPEEAVRILEPVAWKDPDSGLISSLLGAYNRIPDPAWQAAKREELLRRAAADPGDHVAAFLAGVLEHYAGRWEASDRLLEPLVGTFGKQPRLYIYLGMNAFNRGDAAKALRYIETARALDAPDPDVYYCRAEILRWSDPPAALEDLRRYLAQTRGSPTSSAQKRERVETMASLLAACVERGDPIPCEGPWEHPRGHAANTAARPPAPAGWLGIAAAASGAVVLLGVFAVLLRRRRRA